MTNPPPPGNWGPPQPPYGQGQPPYGPGQWPPQHPDWGPPPPPKNNSLKWLLIGVAVLLVIAISVGATLLFTRDGNDGPTQTATGNPPANGEIASANDDGPIRIITDEPTCAPAQSILDALGAEQRKGWIDRDVNEPASAWTAEQRTTYRAAFDAMLRAADQIAELASKTPHRVMHDLYKQASVFWRAYADYFETYTAENNHLVLTASNAANTVLSICTTIDYQVAEKAGVMVSPGPEPDADLTSGVPPQGEAFISPENNSVCDRWTNASEQFDRDTRGWRDSDVNLSSTRWPPEQRALMDQQGTVMSKYADQIEMLGQESDNSVLADFATLSALYWRAFVQAIPSYTTADSYFSAAGSHADSVILNACAVVAG